MSDDHALIVNDGSTVVMDTNDKSVFKFDWDALYLNTGVSIVTATFTITALRPSSASGLTKDSENILTLSPYNSRYTILRLLAGGAAARGQLFEVANKIVTDESPAQTIERSFKVLIENT